MSKRTQKLRRVQRRRMLGPGSQAEQQRKLRKRAHTRMRIKLDRIEVQTNLQWFMIRSQQRWARRLADDLEKEGIPAFEARDEIEVVGRDGRRRHIRVPLLRRIVFVGVRGWPDRLRVLSHYGHDEHDPDGHGWIAVPADELQLFADAFTGHASDEQKRELAFALGDAVQIADGSLASFPGVVEGFNERKGTFRVAVTMFGRETTVEVEERALLAA